MTRWKDDDQVMALVVGGGYAEYCVAHESHALPIPAGLSLIEAAAIPETFFTVWYNMFERGRLAAGETALIHGGSSGIGTTAIQLAKAFGARVVITAGSPEKCEACRKLGADVAVNYRTDDFVAATKKATGEPRRRRRARHGRRRLCRPQLRSGGGRRPHRADRLPGFAARQRRFPPSHVQAAHPYRLDAARALGR